MARAGQASAQDRPQQGKSKQIPSAGQVAYVGQALATGAEQRDQLGALELQLDELATARHIHRLEARAAHREGRELRSKWARRDATGLAADGCWRALRFRRALAPHVRGVPASSCTGGV